MCECVSVCVCSFTVGMCSAVPVYICIITCYDVWEVEPGWEGQVKL